MAGNEELDRVAAGAGAGAAPAGASAAAATPKPGSEPQTTPPAAARAGEVKAPEVAPEVKALIEAEVAKVKGEYEGKGGHIAKLKSEYDKKLARFERQQQQRQMAEYQDVTGRLAELDPALAGQVSALMSQQTHEAQRQQMADWAQMVMEGMGYDLDGDEDAGQFLQESLEHLTEGEDAAWAFTVEAGKRLAAKKTEEAKVALAELQKVKDGLPDLVQQEVKRALVSAGMADLDFSEGGPVKSEDAWRTKPPSQQVADGIAARRAKARPNPTTQGG